MECLSNEQNISNVLNNSSNLEPNNLKAKKIRKSKICNIDQSRIKRRIFYKISDQVFESLFIRFEYLERDKLAKDMFLMDNNEEIYFKNKSLLNKVNYIKYLYN